MIIIGRKKAHESERANEGMYLRVDDASTALCTRDCRIHLCGALTAVLLGRPEDGGGTAVAVAFDAKLARLTRRVSALGRSVLKDLLRMYVLW